ncbi:MAG: hypothetical protein ACJ769_09230, partial [Chloroflexota bacterium]
MTEPHEETDAAPPPTEAAEPVPPPPSPVAEPTTAPAGTPVVPGWIPPEGGGGRNGWRNCCLIVAVLTAAFSVLAVVALVGLIFLGSQVQSILAGTIQYGTGGTGCSVTGTATTFPSSVAIRSVAYLEHEVPA